MMNPSVKLSAMTSVAIDAALQAGAILRQGFGTTFQIAEKPGHLNYVTEFDHAAEKCIMDVVRTHFPTHGFLCEECGSIPSDKSDILWIIDPLDGTTNFTHNIPIFSISIGILSPEGMIGGVIYQPMSNELFVAEKGKGAFLNGSKIKVSEKKEFAGLAATGFPHNIEENPLHCIDHFVKILKKRTIIRNLGSCAVNLAYLAAGRFDAYWAISLYPWDVSAGILLVQEAGGKITDYTGDEYPVLKGGPLVVTNGLLHQSLLNQLKQEK